MVRGLFLRLLLIVAAVLKCAPASARAETCVGVFDLVAHAHVGVQSLRSLENHRAKDGAYCNIASGYRLAAEGGGGGSVGAMAADEAFLNWSPKSTPTWGHTFLTHGEGEASSLLGRAAGTGQAQGMWLDNEAAAQFLGGERPYIRGPASVQLPPGLGQVIRADVTIVPATRATLIPSPGGGFRTAFPIE